MRAFYLLPIIFWCVGMGFILFRPHNFPEWIRERMSDIYLLVAAFLFLAGLFSWWQSCA